MSERLKDSAVYWNEQEHHRKNRFTPSALPPGVVRSGNKVASLSYHQFSVKTKIQVQYFIGSEIYTLETEKGTELLVFSVTSFKIDQNKNQNRRIDKVQNLGKERR